MDVTETLLPGVGIRYEFQTSHGQQLGIIVHRDGHSEMVAYGADDPDACTTLMLLSGDEAEVVADLLGAPRIAQRIADLSREIPGLGSQTVALPAGSRFADRPLGATRTRTQTGCSIVAIVRGEDVIAAPGPEVVLHAGDHLVVIGTAGGLASVRALLETDGG